ARSFFSVQLMRPATYEDLNDLCRGITSSFFHLETRDSYGTEVELPHFARWKTGQYDDLAWLDWWLEMLDRHRAAGRVCRRVRIISEPLSEYQQWTHSHVKEFTDAGEEIRYLPRTLLTATLIPGSGDFYVFDETTVLFLHYSGEGINVGFELTEDPQIARACVASFDEVWRRATSADAYRPQ
ncbi:MAG: DUF6879 family protein, partial [Angustibacter sp.]